MLSSDDENPPNSDPNSVAAAAVVVVSSAPGYGTNPRQSEPRVGPAAAAPASDPPPPQHNHSFSIREYVFRSRSKDIHTNWPFSRKNLQLCFEHGVTEVLPPFQLLDAARCRSFEIPKFDNRSFVGKDGVASQPKPTSSEPKVPGSLRSDRAAELNIDGAASSEQLSSVRSSAADEVPLVATRQVPAKEAIPPPAYLKSGGSAQAAGKKCRLIVKFGTKSERSSVDDTTSNCTAGVSENMASKVCPVCKTFTSSSNTTLNAHIDQCLSLESAPQRSAIRHRIKPRKMRVMVDIYETALRCSIEDLNRRNGLNWANSSRLPAPNADTTSDEERRPMVCAGNLGDAGAVYIDANGTKLRILSKFDDTPPESRGAKDAQLKECLRGKKVSGGMFKKKTKKLHGLKRYNYLKVASKGKKLLSQKGGEGSRGHSSQSSLRPLKSGLSGTLSLRTWSASKRTGLKKKLAAKEGGSPRRHQSHPTPMLDTPENSVYSWSSDSEKERSSLGDRRTLEQEQPVICKRSLAWSDVVPDSVEMWGCPPAKRKLPKKGIEVHAVAGGQAGRQLQPRPSTTKALRFSTLRKRALSLCESSENSSDISSGRMGFRFKKPRPPSVGSEDDAQDRSVKDGADFETSPSESSEREAIDLREVAETGDLHGEVRSAKSALNDAHDAEPSLDTIEDFTWGLSEYYEQAHLNSRDGSRARPRSRQFLDDFSRAYDACDAVDMENADGKDDDEVDGARQSSLFIEIDPIPIPGPPGSFLPSPGAMGSDDFQGNSSLTTSQAQSSHDQVHLVDGDVVDSPVSATSTVSNSAEGKAGMDYSEELVSDGCPLLPEDTWTGFSSAGNNDGLPIQCAPSAAAETISGIVDCKSAKDVSIKKGPPFTREGDGPCCCQKKERAVSQSSASDHCETEPPGLRRFPLAAVPGVARQTDRIPSGGSQSDIRYEGSNMSSRSFGEFPNGSGRGDCDFPSPSGSNPVLRLMGKDLIVVNKEDNAGIPDRSLSNALAPVKSQDPQPLAFRDYSPAHPFFPGSSSGHPGITVPVPVGTFINPMSAGPKHVGGLNPSVQFDAAKVKPVGPSEQMMPKVALVTDDAVSRKEFEFASCIVNNTNLPRMDEVMLPRALANPSRGTSALPTVYHTREPITLHQPVAGLPGSYPKLTVFINGKPDHDADDGHFLRRAPPFVATPPTAFLGYLGSSGYVYYPSYS